MKKFLVGLLCWFLPHKDKKTDIPGGYQVECLRCGRKDQRLS